MGLVAERIGESDTRLPIVSRRMRRLVARVGTGCLLLIGMMCAAPAVAASGTSTAPPAPTTT
jgi:hypothetical protein